MKKPVNIKKMVLPNIPYVFIALLATKLGQAARLAPGFDFSSKAIHIIDGMTMAFQDIVPSFHPVDLCVGIAAATIIRLVVYVKGKNAKKYRKNEESIKKIFSALLANGNCFSVKISFATTVVPNLST